jgi:di/tricarboxylate transporter
MSRDKTMVLCVMGAAVVLRVGRHAALASAEHSPRRPAPWALVAPCRTAFAHSHAGLLHWLAARAALAAATHTSPLDPPPPAWHHSTPHPPTHTHTPTHPPTTNQPQVLGDALGISAVVTAMLGLCALLVTGVLQWRECIGYPAAWDTLFWFAGAPRRKGGKGGGLCGGRGPCSHGPAR